MADQWVVPLDAGTSDMAPLLGGKGAGLAEMLHLGIPTLPGFVVTTEAWKTHTAGSRSLVPDLWKQIRESLALLEDGTGKALGSSINPLIVSVRSSPLVSMPGQLKTILNVGLTAEVVDGLAETSGDRAFAEDTFSRLIRMYGEAVRGIPKDRSADAVEGTVGIGSAVGRLLAMFKQETGMDFPQDPYVQLERSIAAVFESWFAQHVREYRAFHHIPDDQGTAVIVQQMAFGNLGPDSGSGVVFTRNPATGEKGLYGEYLPGSQGEALVGGHVTPRSIGDLPGESPRVYDELQEICSRLENAFRDVQDVEFTVERGKLWILQARSAKRTPIATIRTVVDMATEGLISRDEAVRRVDAGVLDKVFASTIADLSSEDVLGRGIQASPGAATGKVVLDRHQVEAATALGLPAILVTEDTNADDAAILPLVSGILTQHGGATSHAAVVARGLGKACVVGCGGMEIDQARAVVRFGDITVAQGEEISIDGATGMIFRGSKDLVTRSASEFGELDTLLGWADEMAQVRVLADVATASEIGVALDSGVEGIGLCRTERMYYDSILLPHVRVAILGGSSVARETALDELRGLHREEYRTLLRSSQGRTLTVRLLNAPVDYLLPDRDALLTELAELRTTRDWSEETGERERMLQAVDSSRQSNPEFGVRGARLLAAVPELVEAQIEALLQATVDVRREGLPTDLGILIPFVSHGGEIKRFLQVLGGVAHKVSETAGTAIAYRVGAAIETPRAAVVAGSLASLVEFVCIDTDGLTDAVFSLSREDGGKFLSEYMADGILGDDPWTAIDVEGVGSLVRLAVERARTGHPGIEVGVCGSHGLDPSAMSLFNECGVDFVACHLSQLLRARLMAGQQGVGGQVDRPPAGLERE